MTRSAWYAVLLVVVAGCAVRAGGPSPAPNDAALDAVDVLDVREGRASYYGPGFHGRPTASGVPFDMHAMVAAHPTYPFGTLLRVTNLANGRAVRLRVLDRGPAQGPRSAGVIIDVSYGAAEALDFIEAGLIRVRVEVLAWGE